MIYIECTVEINFDEYPPHYDLYILQHNKLSFCTFRWSTSCFYIAGVVEIKIRDSGFTNILQDKTLFCTFEAGDIVC